MKFQWSEIFQSIEGEARWSGHPTVYIRFTNCNFECRGFNNPKNIDPMSEEALNFKPKDLNSIQEISSITIGCDSIYSWHKDFLHLWFHGDESELAKKVLEVLPPYGWKSPSGQKVILSLTGGEPTLRAKQIPCLLNVPEFESLTHVLIETNCSVTLSKKFLSDLDKWLVQRNGLVTWANSPKLTASGESFRKAIRPDVAVSQRSLNSKNFEQYFKFVCGDNEKDFDEVAQVMDLYYKSGVPCSVEVYIMPMACTEEQQKNSMAGIAMKCIERGYIYCHRIQNTVFANSIGK